MRFFLSLITFLMLAARVSSAQQSKSEDRPIGSCGLGGGMSLSPRVSATYSLSMQHDSLYIEGIALGRAQPGWRGFSGSRQPLVPPSRPGAGEFLSGATMDTLFFQFDVAAKIAWVHALKVPLDTNNVVLVDRVDTHGGPPLVTGLYKIPSPIPLKGDCRDRAVMENVFTALEKALRAIPAVDAFVGPKGQQR